MKVKPPQRHLTNEPDLLEKENSTINRKIAQIPHNGQRLQLFKASGDLNKSSRTTWYVNKLTFCLNVNQQDLSIQTQGSCIGSW